MLEELTAQPGQRYFDTLVAQAFYLQAPFIRPFEQPGLRWMISLNNNQPDPAASAGRLSVGPLQGSERLAEGQLDYWYLAQIYWSAANGSVSRLKTVCRRSPRHSARAGKRPRRGRHPV